MNSETSRTLDYQSNFNNKKFNVQPLKNGYKVGTSYETKNAGKGQEKIFMKSLSSKISGDLNFFGKNG